MTSNIVYTVDHGGNCTCILYSFPDTYIKSDIGADFKKKSKVCIIAGPQGLTATGRHLQVAIWDTPCYLPPDISVSAPP